MHRTRSIDYWVIIQGEVTLPTDKGGINLKAGDVIVNRGGDHAWYRKPGSKPCLAVSVSIYAKANAGIAQLAG
jgi:mannose-6-phosphate isomerase-like protein (cupin superfamily)